MKGENIIRRCLQKAYFFAFPHGVLNEAELPYNCALGEDSKIYRQATVQNESSHKANITIGNNTHVVGNLTVWSNAGRIEIGDWCFVGEGSRILSACQIQIGNRVQIAHNCNIFDSNIHSSDPSERHLVYPEYHKRVAKTL